MSVVKALGYFVFVKIANPETDPTTDSHISPTKPKKKGGRGGLNGPCRPPYLKFYGCLS